MRYLHAFVQWRRLRRQHRWLRRHVRLHDAADVRWSRRPEEVRGLRAIVQRRQLRPELRWLWRNLRLPGEQHVRERQHLRSCRCRLQPGLRFRADLHDDGLPVQRQSGRVWSQLLPGEQYLRRRQHLRPTGSRV
jgi:hypothetical protein